MSSYPLTASMYPALSTARLMETPIVIPRKSVRDEIVTKVRSAFAARTEGSRLLDQAKAAVERLVLAGGE